MSANSAPSHEAADPSYWRDRWGEKKTAWQNNNTYFDENIKDLLHHYHAHKAGEEEGLAGRSVLVPLCGDDPSMAALSGKDVRADVVGIDASSIALRSFITTNYNVVQHTYADKTGGGGKQMDLVTPAPQTDPAKTSSVAVAEVVYRIPDSGDDQKGIDVTLFECHFSANHGSQSKGEAPPSTAYGRLRLYCGDFFVILEHLMREDEQRPFEAVYDRASFIALPPSLRPRYSSSIKVCLAPGGAVILLAAIDRGDAVNAANKLKIAENKEKNVQVDTGLPGPPFSSPQEDVRPFYTEGEGFQWTPCQQREGPPFSEATYALLYTTPYAR